MSRNRIGPYIERLSEFDGRGRYRLTFLDDFPPKLISSTLTELRSLEDSKARKVYSRYSPFEWGYGFASEIEAIVRGDRKPSDETLNDQYFYTDFQYWKDHHARWMPSYPHRILIDAYVTKAGNLSVRFSPKCLGRHGHWVHAPEWREIAFLGHSDIMERPNDEVLFIRDVTSLLADNIEHLKDYRGAVGDEDQKRFAAHCNAINMVFWLVVHRLSRRFEVHLSRYVTMLTSGKDAEDCLGLGIVDALADHRTELEEDFKAFKQDTGYGPQRFWEVCEKTKVGYSFDRASKMLRGASGPTAELTPSVVRSYYDLLDTAARYGIWRPKPPEPEEAVSALSDTIPVIKPPELPRSPRVARNEVTSEIRLPVAGKEVPVRQERVKPSQEPDRVAHDPLSPPSYEGLRQATLSAEVKAEFGIRTVRELVDRLNTLWRGQGRAPIPQGSFPTNAAKLKYVVSELRKALG